MPRMFLLDVLLDGRSGLMTVANDLGVLPTDECIVGSNTEL
jgi:hypothetical protein